MHLSSEGSLLPVTKCVVLKYYQCLIKYTGTFYLPFKILTLLSSETTPLTRDVRSSSTLMALRATRAVRRTISVHLCWGATHARGFLTGGTTLTTESRLANFLYHYSHNGIYEMSPRPSDWWWWCSGGKGEAEVVRRQTLKLSSAVVRRIVSHHPVRFALLS
jgi:hypothetical protein